jgi:hypothetical protein
MYLSILGNGSVRRCRTPRSVRRGELDPIRILEYIWKYVRVPMGRKLALFAGIKLTLRNLVVDTLLAWLISITADLTTSTLEA